MAGARPDDGSRTAESHAPLRTRGTGPAGPGRGRRSVPQRLAVEVHPRGRSRAAAAGSRSEVPHRLRAAVRGQHQPGRGLGRRDRRGGHRGGARNLRDLPQPAGRCHPRLHADRSHLLGAHGSYMLAQDLFFIDAQAGYSDSIIDAGVSTNYGGTGLFNRSNMEETGRASITPRLTKQLGGFQFDASYTYGRVWYFESDDAPPNPDSIFVGFNEDSEDQRAYASLGTADMENAATLKGFYEWRESTFELSQPFRYERTGLDTSLRLTRTLRLVADGGVESDLTESTTEGGLDAEFWHAGFRWQPDSRTYIDARYGERFFGDSYSFEARRETRLLTLRASYSEDPEVETRRIGIDVDPD